MRAASVTKIRGVIDPEVAWDKVTLFAAIFDSILWLGFSHAYT